MPSVDLAALPSAMTRPLVVAIAHLPILIVVFCAAPLWLISFWRPNARNDLALRLLKEIRTWSCEIVQAADGVRAR